MLKQVQHDKKLKTSVRFLQNLCLLNTTIMSLVTPSYDGDRKCLQHRTRPRYKNGV